MNWSPLTESNRRPSPYHGDALPTELRGQVADRWLQRWPTRTHGGLGATCPPTGSPVPGEHTRPEIGTDPGGRRAGHQRAPTLQVSDMISTRTVTQHSARRRSEPGPAAERAWVQRRSKPGPDFGPDPVSPPRDGASHSFVSGFVSVLSPSHLWCWRRPRCRMRTAGNAHLGSEHSVMRDGNERRPR